MSIKELEKNLPGLKSKCEIATYSKLALEKKKEYEMSLSRWLPDYPDPMTYLEVFLSGSSVNNTGYANPEYDALIKRLKQNWVMKKKHAGKHCKMLKNVIG